MVNEHQFTFQTTVLNLLYKSKMYNKQDPFSEVSIKDFLSFSAPLTHRHLALTQFYESIDRFQDNQ